MTNDLVQTWLNCDGYYCCPKNNTGKRLGPLVGYAGKYDAPDGTEKRFVGDVYWNFARVEQCPEILDYFAAVLAKNIRQTDLKPTLLLAAPMGGILLAGILGSKLGVRTIFAEKKVTAIATPDKREESKLVVDRHNIGRNSKVLIVEDTCHNFSTTKELVGLISCTGSTSIGIACALNVSEKCIYYLRPIFSSIYLPTKQWRQDDPAVQEDISKGNVVWKPKDDWDELVATMKEKRLNKSST